MRIAVCVIFIFFVIILVFLLTCGSIAVPRSFVFPALESECTAINETLDAVILWVDGSDPVWQEKFRKTTGKKPNMCRYSASIDEVKWCVQQLKKQLWLRNIYIVSDEQKHPSVTGVTWIDHSDIFPDYVRRPCFNSTVIETYVHNITDLSDKFIYLNDDFILCRALPENYHTLDSGRMRYNSSAWGLDASLSVFMTLGRELVSRNIKKSDMMLRKSFQLPFYKYVPLTDHGPIMCSVTGIEKALASIGDEILKEQAQHQRRHKSNFIFLTHYWPNFAVLSGLGEWTCSKYRCKYVFINDSVDLLKNQLMDVEKLKPAVICLNDSRHKNFDATSEYVSKWLERFMHE
jgi:hypothetical protein